MLESDLNRIIFSSIRDKNELNFSEKISDSSPTKKCFDGIASFENKFWAIESKLIKGNFTSFNFKRLEQHQIDNLLKIRMQTINASGVESVVIVGYFEPRKICGIFIFDILAIVDLLGKDIWSLKQDKILRMKEKFFINISSVKQGNKRVQMVDDVNWTSKIIRKEDIINI